MAFALSPATAFVAFVTKIPASWLNFVRVSLPNAVDGVNAGTYNLAPGHTLWFPAGGGSISIDAPLSFSNAEIPVSGTLDVYGVINIESGGWIDLLPSTVSGIKVESGAKIEVKANGTIQIDASALLLAQNSSTVVLQGDTYVVDGGGGGTSGSLIIGDSILGTGRITVTADGSVTFQSSSLCTWGPGAEALFSGSGALLQLQTGATLFMGSSAGTATFNNVLQAANVTLLNLTGTMTKLAGTSAGGGAGTGRIGLRVGAPTNPDTTQHFDPTFCDILNVDSSTIISGTVTWSLDPPADGIASTVICMFLTNTAGSGTLVIQNTGGGGLMTIQSTNLTDEPFAIMLVSAGGAWTVATPQIPLFSKYLASIP